MENLIYKATIGDLDALSELAVMLWENHTTDEIRDEFAGIMQSKNAAFFLQYYGDTPVGFAQCQLRHDYVEGTKSSPVGYLEGIFVRPEYRNNGYARALLSECENWAASMGCGEFASDCEVDNDASLKFHTRMGFAQANRIICFTKKL